MIARSFFDTNILVYTDDADAADKRQRALDVWKEHRAANAAVLSVQVLKEYYVASTRKLGVDPLIAIEKLELFRRAEVVLQDAVEVVTAARLAVEQKISFWDAMIVRAAIASGCAVLLSEDMQCGRHFESVTIVDPFA